MTMMLVRPNAAAEAPTVQKIRGTLLDAANIIEGYTWPDADQLYTSFNCIATSTAATDICTDGSVDLTGGPAVVEGIAFNVYTGFQCKTIGLDWDFAQTEVMRVMGNKESNAVEANLMAQRFIAGGNWGAPTDLTPSGGPVSLDYGLGLLEADAALNYAGQPTIHVPRSVASVLITRFSDVGFQGDTLYTALGSKLAAGAGYEDNTGPDGSPAPAGTAWLYATGSVTVRRSNIIVPTREVDYTHNIVSILAERFYVVDVDCYASAVNVSLS